MKRSILIATTNSGKIAELAALLDADVDWMSLSDFGDIAEVVEDGLTFAANARKKALGYARATGQWTIADDSGLVVDALDGAPGVNSARFSGCKDNDRAIIDLKNIEKVLSLLRNIPGEKRTARFVCHICLADIREVLLETEGTVEGVIAENPIGQNGFGYDPVFFIPRLNKTVAQLSAEQKNAISHRGNAIRKLKPLLDKLLQTT